jgi:hypothetical protein
MFLPSDIAVVTDEADNCTAAPTVAFVGDVSDGNTCPEVITRTYSVTDDCGNAINVTQTITVDDTTVPTFTAPADITINADLNCNYDASVGNTVDVTDEADNCSVGLNATFVDVTVAGACPGAQVITRTWSLIDDCGNAVADQVQTITVEDNSGPVLVQGSIDPHYTTVAAAEAAAMAATTATDNCSVNLTSMVATVGNCPATITVTFTDECGNSSDAIYTTDIHDIVLNPQIAFQPVCVGGSVLVQGNASGGSAPLTHLWTIDLSSSATGSFLSATNLPDAIVQGYTPGTLVLNYTVTDNNGCSTASLVNVTMDGSCAQFGIVDPCDCKNDASVDGDNGSFLEVVAVTGAGGNALPAGQIWTVQTITGAYTEDAVAGPGATGAPIAIGTTLTYDSGDENYSLTFDHVDAQGYTVTVEGPNAPGTPGNYFLSVANTCFYPHPVIVAPLTVCTGSSSFIVEVQGVDAGANVQASPFDTDGDDTTTESVNWLNGVTGEVDPGANDFPGGVVTIYYHYDAPDAPGTSSPGCGLTVSFTMNSNNMPPLAASAAVVGNVSCFDGSDGSANVTVNGGSPGYTYLWNNGETTVSINNLTEGVYEVTATDAFGCTAAASAVISEPSQLTATITAQTNVMCNGANTGSATVSAAGGTTDYEYLWSNSQTDATATGLGAGVHTVTVTDENDCTAVASVSITQPTGLLAEITTTTNTSCFGAADGTATVNATGGTTPYAYEWPNSQTTATATGLAAGTYEVTVTDENDCTATVIATIVEGVAIDIANITDLLLCPGESIGDILLTSIPANADVSFIWTGGAALGLADGGPVTGLNSAIPGFTASTTEGSATVTVTATLLTCTATEDFSITINDATAPAMTCPADITVGNDVDQCGAHVTFALPTATDNCGNVTVTQTDGLFSGALFPVGDSDVTFTADDNNGNETTCEFTVTVSDDQTPTAVCQDITVDLDASGNASIVAADVDGGSSDNCPAGLTLAISTNTFDCDNMGDNNVTLTVTDGNSNGSSCVATVTVRDVTAPSFSCPAAITLASCTDVVPDVLSGISDEADNCGVADTSRKTRFSGFVLRWSNNHHRNGHGCERQHEHL